MTALALRKEPQLDVLPPLRRSAADALWAVGDEQARSQAHMLGLWLELRRRWLAMASSPATAKTYATASQQWLDHIAAAGVLPWEVTAATVRGWQAALEGAGKSPATVAARLAACSSFYRFVINEVHIVDGIERTAFFDRAGRTRANPFLVGNTKRPKVTPYGKARVLSPADLDRLFSYLMDRRDTLIGSRNFALLLTHYLTGCRGSEICRLRWGDIRPNRNQPGGFVFAWQGKGNKAEDTPLPVAAYAAMRHYLALSGRDPGTLAEDAPIFLPLVTSGLANFAVGPDAAGTPITERQVQRIFQSCLRRAGVDGWKKYRIHDLRHTFAHMLYAQTKDLEHLRQLLHHESQSTTGIYTRALNDAVDAHSAILLSKLGVLIPAA